MYTQENKSGWTQYFLCILSCLVLWILCDIIGVFVKNSFVSDILFLLSSAVMVYLIYVHYCAVFIYELDKKKLIITRKVGKRNAKCVEITLSKINMISRTKPSDLPKDIQNFAVGVINKKNYCYLIYDKRKKCIIFEPDSELISLLDSSCTQNY